LDVVLEQHDLVVDLVDESQAHIAKVTTLLLERLPH
jgi:hypothetical protein